MRVPERVRNILRIAIEEDVGYGDITTLSVIPEEKRARAVIISKGNFIVAGIPFAQEVFSLIDPDIDFTTFYNDGSRVKKRDIIAEITGRARTILTGERVCLNLLQRLSGIATMTAAFVEKIKDLNVKIVDTRKTTPSLRFLEKYAVRVGGGYNHRFGLYDGILIKDNHIEAAGSIINAIEAARRYHHLSRIEVEVENVNDLKEALKGGADVVMLDNMTIEEMKEAVRLAKGKVILEASGNINLNNVRAVAETGVDLISVGAITHSAPAVDISMKIVSGHS
ncbi:MAG: carboxylating nicotinate-nucleotide diphosphorylase [Thermodesulfovibrionales bacterium]